MKINFFGDFVTPPKKNCNKISISEDLKALMGCADLNVINYEAPSWKSDNSLPLPIPKSGPSLCQDAQMSRWLKDNGFALASLANNHIFDYGEDGYNSTIASLGDIHTFGAGDWAEAYKPYVTEVESEKVAFVSLTHCEFGTLTDKWDKRFTKGTAWINHPDVDRIISETLEQVDRLFVFAHAGVELIEQPLPEWRDRYRAFIDLGCDAVIASHPHIAQGWEMYNGKPIVYSLGNFYFPKPDRKPDFWYKSLCASIVCEGDRVNLEITPLGFDDASIGFDKSMATSQYLERINRILNDDELYVDEINRTCVSMLDNYYRMFCSGGLVADDYIALAKAVAKKMLKRYVPHIPTLINNLRCESHRYCIIRALKIKENIQ